MVYALYLYNNLNSVKFALRLCDNLDLVKFALRLYDDCCTPKQYLPPGLPDPDRVLGQEEPLALRASSSPPQLRSQHRSLGLLLSTTSPY